MGAAVSIALVPRENISEVWTVAGPQLDKAISRASGRYHVVDLLTACLEGKQSLWIAVKDGEIIGSTTLSVNEYPGGARISRIEFLGGKLRDDWFQEMWDTLAKYSAELGCSILETTARPGVGEYIKQFGGRQTAGFYEYDLRKVT